MAADAGPADAGVIEPGAREGHGALVACFARSICDDVVRRFPECGSAVVATGAVCNESCVIHPGAGECHGALVAVFARRIGDDVVWSLAQRGHAVVASHAAIGDARVDGFGASHG